LFPEIAAWWESKSKGPHLVALSATSVSPKPIHAPVLGCPVKPSGLQKIFAREWIWLGGLLGTAVGLTLVLAIQAYPDWAQMYVLVFAGAVGGFMLSVVLIRLLRHIRVKINGGPFRKGDLVQVLTGPHAGKIAAVYEEWTSRGEVRVDLGEQEWKETKDVFSQVQLCRVKRADRTVPANSLSA
jgi:hypothetical protein